MASHDTKPLMVAQHPGNGAPGNGASNQLPALTDSSYVRSNVYVAAPPAPPESGPPSGGASFASLARAFRRRWALALGVALAGAALVVAAVFVLMPPQYRASVWFSFPRVDSEDLTVLKSNQAAMVKSPKVTGLALSLKTTSGRDAKDLGIVRAHPDTAGWLESAVKVEFPSPVSMRVSLAADDAEETAELLNAIASALLLENEGRFRTTRDGRVEKLKVSKRRLDDEIRGSQALLDSKLKVHWEKNPDNALKLAEKAAEDAERYFRENEKALKEKKARLENLRARIKDIDKLKVAPERLDDYLRADPRASGLFTAVGKIQQDIIETNRVAPAEAAATLVVRLETERAGLLSAIAKLRESLRPELEDRVRAAELIRSQDQALNLEDDIKTLDQASGDLRKEAFHAQSHLNKVSSISPIPPELRNMQDTITTLKKVRDKMAENVETMANDDYQPNVIIQNNATTPSGKDASRQIKLAGAGGFGIFCVLLLGVTYLELRSRKIGDAEELTSAGLNVVGTIPPMPKGARQLANGAAAPAETLFQSQLAESVDAIRTMLMHVSRTDSLRVVMVTSAVGGEGKTSLASQLASSLARAWRKTLLIDGDLRHPAGHALFGLPLEPGFSEVLRGEVKAADAIKPTPLSRLWMMPAGHWDSHAVQALAQDNVRSLLEQLKQQYDFIIVDSCPVLPVADSLVLGQHVDGVLFSVLRDVSRLPALQAAQQKMTNLGIRTLGAVMIGAKADLGSAAYKYTAAGV